MRSTNKLCALGAIALLTACPTNSAERGDSGAGANNTDGGANSNTYMGDAGCQRTSQTLAIDRVEQVDLLLVVDNSNSMAGEQQSLKTALPSLIHALATGYRSVSDPHPFPPIKDLHVGVVSTDLGIAGVDFPPRCRADGGDDGRLQNTPRGANCDAKYSLWLSFVGDPKLGPLTNPPKFANDIACISTLGTAGCGFEQQLEAPFKALMPKLLTDASGNVIENPYRFLSMNEPGTWGRPQHPKRPAHGQCGRPKNNARKRQWQSPPILCAQRGRRSRAIDRVSAAPPCDVVWELPLQAPPGSPTPVSCDQLAFLSPVVAQRVTKNANGGVSCKLEQLAVTNAASKTAPQARVQEHVQSLNDRLCSIKIL